MTVSFTESLKYVKNQCVSAEEVAFKDAFTCDCLKSWYDLKRNKALAIGYDWQSAMSDILNAFLDEKYGLKVKPDCARIIIIIIIITNVIYRGLSLQHKMLLLMRALD